MARQCTVCTHADAKKINKQLAEGVPLATIAKAHGLTTSSLQRHKRHISKPFAKAEAHTPQDSGGDNGRGRSRKADNILQALLTHRTIREAAATARVSERVIYDYLNDPAFEARYKAARDDIIRGVSNHLREQMNEAIDIIGDIMRDPENRPQDRLAAAKAVLDFGDKYTESGDILERIGKLERSADEENGDA